MIIKCIAIDDEPLALDKIEGYVNQVPYLKLEGRFCNALAALPYLKGNTIDLLFLDIQMDGLTGIQLLESLTVKPRVILTTAFDQYALKGFELNVTDYLLKPISFSRFLKAVEKVYDHMAQQSKTTTQAAPSNTEAAQKDFIFVKSGSQFEKISFAEILYIEGMKDYLRIHTPAKKVMTLMSFSEIEKMLPSENFVRIHKSYIVAINKIEVIDRAFVKIGGNNLPIGDVFRKTFRQKLDEQGLVF